MYTERRGPQPFSRDPRSVPLYVPAPKTWPDARGFARLVAAVLLGLAGLAAVCIALGALA